jgi:hypothetical protein
MDHRFPPLRPQVLLSSQRPALGRTLPGRAPVDLTFLAALVLIAALALA